MIRRLCSGNQMLAEGALAAGCSFFAGYPIAPASEIYEVMMDELPMRGGLALSAPDEISALCYCVGASLRGLKAMTATSGPGWALMIETIQYALMTETPVVVALVQRLGSTNGGATQGAQGDVGLAGFSTSGGYTLPMFSPSDAAECYELALHAFNWSERLRTPVVLLSDKEVGMTSEVVQEDALQIPGLVNRKSAGARADYAPYDFDELGGVPPFAAVGGEIKVTVTGSGDDRGGRVLRNSPQVIKMLQHLQRKIDAHAEEMALVKPDLDPDARCLLISYGVTARAARQAIRSLRSEGSRISFLQIQSLFPIPRRWLDSAAAGVETVFVAEENLTGQYRAALAPFLSGKRVYGINKIGKLISPSEIACARAGGDSVTAEDLYLAPNAKLPYCKGCGHALVVRHLSHALQHLQLPPHSVVLTTDIGCVGLADSLFPYLHTVHTTHGRSTAFATGMALAEATLESTGLKPIVMIGDGGAMIGLLHLVHAAQLNVDITVLVHNNFMFGMTGGQHSALSPLNWVTSTPPEGNWTSPLDLPALLRTAHASFLARQFATSPDLATTIANAINFPGFSLVEIDELCTAYATRWNQVRGGSLQQIIERQGYALGEMQSEMERPTFRELWRHELKSRPPRSPQPTPPCINTPQDLAGEVRVVVADTAGEGVPSAVDLFCRVALAAGLWCTQKNDNPVTQGSGFSISEICLSAGPIDYTGMESPDVILAVSDDGWKELQANGTLAACREETLLFMDSQIAARPPAGRVVRLPLRRNGNPKHAALTAVAAWLVKNPVLPWEAWEAVLATEPPERRAELTIALETGRRLACEGVA